MQIFEIRSSMCEILTEFKMTEFKHLPYIYVLKCRQ